MITEWVCNPIAPGHSSETGYEPMQALRCHDLASRTVITLPGETPARHRSHLAALTDGTAIVGGWERGWSTVGACRFRGEPLAAYWPLPLDPEQFESV